MRYLTKLNMLGSLAFISILIALSLLYASTNFNIVDNKLSLGGAGTSTDKIAEGAQVNNHPASPIPIDADRRLVVFGDAWSAAGSQLAEQGHAWPEWVCSMWPCHLETYAQREHVCESSICGSVIDETEIHTIVSDAARSLEQLPDLRSQIDQWLASELNKALNDPTSGDWKARSENTIFAVSFLIWDIWKFNGVPIEDMENSMNRSLGTLFEQLYRLAKHTDSDNLRILLMMAIDPTFLPAFDPTQGQKDTIDIVTDWNNKLKEKASNWNNGSRQFYLAGMLDDHGLGSQNLWDDVESPCVASQSTWLPFLGTKDQRCENPERFLFWDGLHLGPKANQMMATEIFHDIETLWTENPNSTHSTKRG